jgi:hypothetical protein
LKVDKELVMLANSLSIATLVLGTLASAIAVPAPIPKPVLATPAKAYNSIKDIYIDFFGPKSSWVKIKAIDLYPNATFDGLPVSSSIILGYSPPAIPEAKLKLFKTAVADFDEKKKLDTRDNIRCNNGFDAVVAKDQLQWGKNSACDAAAKYMSGGSGSIWSLWKNYYQKPDGNWYHFTKPWGNGDTSVLYELQAFRSPQDMYNFDWNSCFNTYYNLIWTCGSPDCPGGDSTGAKYFARVDPA